MHMLMTHIDSQMLYPLDLCEVLCDRDETIEAPADNILFKSFSNEGNFIKQ